MGAMTPADPPPVSVIIPARDAADSLPRTLRSILDQDYPGPVEVVVAAADEPSARSARNVASGVKVVANPAGTTPAGLNAALAASSGSIVVRCDAHAVLPPGYVTRAVETLQRTGAANVGGRQVPRGQSWWERAVALAMTSPLGAGDARYRLGGDEGPTDTVYLGVFRREALEAVGGFDETLLRNQDYELNWRLRLRGETVWFDPALAVDYRPRGSLRRLARQYFDYGRWKRRVLRRHPASLRARQLAAPLLVFGLAASAGLAFTPARPLAVAVPALYGGFLAAGSTVVGIRRREPAAVALPLVLATMHLAWGIGFFLPPHE